MPARRSSAATRSPSWCAPVKRSRTTCAGSFRMSCRANFSLPLWGGEKKNAMTEKTDITLNINGRDYPIRVEPRKTLLDAIRDDCGQTGTHSGCAPAVCGTCTIIVDDEAVRPFLKFLVRGHVQQGRSVVCPADAYQ